VRVAVLTTSYPRHADDVAGAFVRDGVEALRELGVEVTVVSPADFPHFGIAYGHGIVGNLRRQPWRLLLVPAFLVCFARAARRAARDADVVHAHWLVSGVAALATGKPLVLQPWGTDMVLAERARPLARRLLLPAAAVVCASNALADAARALGARTVEVIPSGVRVPEAVRAPVEPRHVLFAGRLSEEKGIREFLAATDGLPRVVVGDGPLRAEVPESVGFVPPEEIGVYYERAAVVCVPSLREGYGVVAREAMAYGRPVVASRAGGLVDAVEDGRTGLLVEPGDVAGLRAAVTRLLDDPGLAGELGAAARAHAVAHFGLEASARALVEVYERVRE
jgi:glycosyltransferase involved in cell wall biosynthesis